MPRDWKKEYSCEACGDPFPDPSTGQTCCTKPDRRPGQHFVQWARRIGFEHMLTVCELKHPIDKRKPFWFRVLLFPNVAYGNGSSHEDAAKQCEKLHDAFGG